MTRVAAAVDAAAAAAATVLIAPTATTTTPTACARRYTAHRRALPSGLTEYRSVTVIPDTSPLEYVDFSLDDTCRRVIRPEMHLEGGMCIW